MLEMREEGLTHREIAEKNGYTKKQVTKFFERQNKKARLGERMKIPNVKGRPHKYPVTQEQGIKRRINELERENELLRSFLHAAGRM